jgi:hypothetical protein
MPDEDKKTLAEWEELHRGMRESEGPGLDTDAVIRRFSGIEGLLRMFADTGDTP